MATRQQRQEQTQAALRRIKQLGMADLHEVASKWRKFDEVNVASFAWAVPAPPHMPRDLHMAALRRLFQLQREGAPLTRDESGWWWLR